jgi:hypothetical protein
MERVQRNRRANDGDLFTVTCKVPLHPSKNGCRTQTQQLGRTLLERPLFRTLISILAVCQIKELSPSCVLFFLPS